MGRFSDNSIAYLVPSFDNPFDFIALGAYLVSFGFNIYFSGVFGLQLYKRRKAGLLSVVFLIRVIIDILMLMHFYSDSPPIVYCLFGAVGTFGTMLSAIVEAEILRMFCALGSIVSERTIRYIEVGIVLWYLVLSVGVNADFFFVGVPRPAWLDAYIIIATPIFLTTTFLYIIVQSIYLMFLTWGTHLQFRKEIGLQAGNFNFFIVLFSLDILCAVAYGILWLIGMQHTGASPNYSVLGFAFGNMVQSFSAMVLRKIRTIRSQKTAREALSIDTAVKTVKS